MKLKVNGDIDWLGTSLIGYITISYADLKKVLKKHASIVSDKVKVLWAVEAEYNGKTVLLTVYDYQDRNKIADKTQWHIGGEDETALEVMRELFPTGKVMTYDEYSTMVRARWAERNSI